MRASLTLLLSLVMFMPFLQNALSVTVYTEDTYITYDTIYDDSLEFYNDTIIENSTITIGPPGSSMTYILFDGTQNNIIDVYINNSNIYFELSDQFEYIKFLNCNATLMNCVIVTDDIYVHYSRVYFYNCTLYTDVLKMGAEIYYFWKVNFILNHHTIHFISVDTQNYTNKDIWLQNGVYTYSIYAPHFIPISGFIEISNANIFEYINIVPDWDEDNISDDMDDDDDNDGWNDTFEHEAGSDPYDSSSLPPDLDDDDIPDLLDDDIDGDGWSNTIDKFPYDVTEWNDTDNDGQGDNKDPDLDNDGWVNDIDDFPFNETEWLDTDGDGIGDNTDDDDDGDGYNDTSENWYGTNTLDPEDTPPDFDGDGIADIFDSDKDGDGYLNDHDSFPDDPYEWLDTDGDGIGDNADDDDDNDDFDDDYEIKYGTDPKNSTDFPSVIVDDDPPPLPNGSSNNGSDRPGDENGHDDDVHPYDGNDGTTEGKDTAPVTINLFEYFLVAMIITLVVIITIGINVFLKPKDPPPVYQKELESDIERIREEDIEIIEPPR